ncbi:MAG: protein-export rane protein SecG [Actinomycetota bacterium]|jgi:preprotein translocase subunit SecG
MPRHRAIALQLVRSVVMYITLVINVISMFSLIVGVLLHSGQGGGLSDMFGGASGAALGSAAAERNLNRITAVFATVWLFTVIALAFLLSK